VLVLFGTGIRNRSAPAAVTCQIGGENAAVQYASSAPRFIGLDQVNALVPRSLTGRGEVDIALTVDGKLANPVKVSFRYEFLFGSTARMGAQDCLVRSIRRDCSSRGARKRYPGELIKSAWRP